MPRVNCINSLHHSARTLKVRVIIQAHRKLLGGLQMIKHHSGLSVFVASTINLLQAFQRPLQKFFRRISRARQFKRHRISVLRISAETVCVDEDGHDTRRQTRTP